MVGLGSILTQQLQARFLARIDLLGGLPAGGVPGFAQQVAAGNLGNAMAAVPGPLRVAVTAAARDGFAGAFGAVLAVAGLLAAVAAALCWILVRYADTRPAAARLPFRG